MKERFIAFVAEIMEVDSDEISMETKYSEYNPWDSLMMLTLVMELEAEYGITIPMEKVNEVETLQDLYQLVETAS